MKKKKARRVGHRQELPLPNELEELIYRTEAAQIVQAHSRGRRIRMQGVWESAIQKMDAADVLSFHQAFTFQPVLDDIEARYGLKFVDRIIEIINSHLLKLGHEPPFPLAPLYITPRAWALIQRIPSILDRYSTSTNMIDDILIDEYGTNMIDEYGL